MVTLPVLLLWQRAGAVPESVDLVSGLFYLTVGSTLTGVKVTVGIFDPLMMQNLNRQSEQLRAGANYHLLGAMRRLEERDREKFSQPPNQ